MYRGRIYVPNSNELKNMILGEMHNAPYALLLIKKLLQLSRANIIRYA
jgi:hypothetical protein